MKGAKRFKHTFAQVWFCALTSQCVFLLLSGLVEMCKLLFCTTAVRRGHGLFLSLGAVEYCRAGWEGGKYAVNGVNENRNLMECSEIRVV